MGQSTSANSAVTDRRYSKWLNRFAWLTCVATLLLICSGGMVTSKNVGLAVPDWPTTFGYNMFLFPDFKMGRRNFVRAHASIDGFAGRISHDHPRRVALAARRPAMGPQPGCHRGSRCDSARNSGRSSSHDDERSNRHLSRVCRAGVSRAACFHCAGDDEILGAPCRPASRFAKVFAN